jgi:hypothetical protein
MSLYVPLDLLCDSILSANKNIQSVAVINHMGRPVEKAARSRFERQFPDCMNELFCMHCVLTVSMGQDFDENYGPINYHISERGNLTTLSFPFDKDVILVIINKNISPITLARKIASIISEFGSVKVTAQPLNESQSL